MGLCLQYQKLVSKLRSIPGYTFAKTSLADSIMESLVASYHESLNFALSTHQFNFVLTDPRLPDHPIVYASDGFLRMTGYTAEEVLGRNCRFLQGPSTDRRAVLEIRDAIREEKACQVTILNYTKQGRPFWNLFHMAPVFSLQDGTVVHFVGVQTPIANSCRSAVGIHQKTTSSILAPSSPADHEFSQVIADCFCSSGSTDSSQVSDEGIICEAQQADKEKSISSVRCIMKELAESSRCKGMGVTETRCRTINASCYGGERVVCSSLMLSLTKVQQSFVLANPHLPDTPIVHASDMFLQLTGYSREEVVGRNCRFLQGPHTDMKAVQQIRESFNSEKPCTVRILNYRKDKTPFWNFLHIAPVRSSGGKVAFFVGVQLDVTSANEETCLGNGMTPHIKQLGAIGAVRVAVRSLQGQGLRRVENGIL